MIQFITKLLIYRQIYNFIKERIVGISFTVIMIFLIIYIHSEYLNYIEFKEKTSANYIGLSFIIKKNYDDIVLSGALAKIDNVMSGIMSMARGGIIRDPSFTYYNEGGSAKKPPIKDPIPVKKIDIMDYHKLGMTLADLSDYERDLVKELLDKTLFKTK